jgi:hypothetical protein
MSGTLRSRAAAKIPLLLVVEDLHLADSCTVDLILSLRCEGVGIAFLRRQFVYDRLVHSPELWKGSAAFLQHGQRKGAHVWILFLSGSHELTSGFLLSVSAPHQPTQEYVIAVHVHLQLNRNRARMLPKSGCHDCRGRDAESRCNFTFQRNRKVRRSAAARLSDVATVT